MRAAQVTICLAAEAGLPPAKVQHGWWHISKVYTAAGAMIHLANQLRCMFKQQQNALAIAGSPQLVQIVEQLKGEMGRWQQQKAACSGELCELYWHRMQSTPLSCDLDMAFSSMFHSLSNAADRPCEEMAVPALAAEATACFEQWTVALEHCARLEAEVTTVRLLCSVQVLHLHLTEIQNPGQHPTTCFWNQVST